MTWPTREASFQELVTTMRQNIDAVKVQNAQDTFVIRIKTHNIRLKTHTKNIFSFRSIKIDLSKKNHRVDKKHSCSVTKDSSALLTH